MPRQQDVLALTDEAIDAILGIRAEEPDAETLALTLAITGVRNLQFIYELTFTTTEDGGDDDVLQTFGELPVIIRADSVTIRPHQAPRWAPAQGSPMAPYPIASVRSSKIKSTRRSPPTEALQSW
jgi:hypothetical protein